MTIQDVENIPNLEKTSVLVTKAVGSLSASIRIWRSSGSRDSVSHREGGCFCSSSIAPSVMIVSQRKLRLETCNCNQNMGKPRNRPVVVVAVAW